MSVTRVSLSIDETVTDQVEGFIKGQSHEIFDVVFSLTSSSWSYKRDVLVLTQGIRQGFRCGLVYASAVHTTVI